MTNQELLSVVTEAYDLGFTRGFSIDRPASDTLDVAELLDHDYIGRRDDWIRAHVPKGATV